MRDYKFLKKSSNRKKVGLALGGIDGPIKLNIGCGTDYKEDWVNVDNNSDENIERLDLNWDMRNPLPFEENSVDYVFNEHFLEHLTVEEGQVVIKDLMRVLKPGGVLRIAVPDLEVVVNKYLKNNLTEDPTIKKFDLTWIKTRAEFINVSFRWWGHKWLYDFEELKRRIEEAGFLKIERCELGKSSHPALNNLEIREESLVVEVTK